MLLQKVWLLKKILWVLLERNSLFSKLQMRWVQKLRRFVWKASIDRQSTEPAKRGWFLIGYISWKPKGISASPKFTRSIIRLKRYAPWYLSFNYWSVCLASHLRRCLMQENNWLVLAKLSELHEINQNSRIYAGTWKSGAKKFIGKFKTFWRKKAGFEVYFEKVWFLFFKLTLSKAKTPAQLWRINQGLRRKYFRMECSSRATQARKWVVSIKLLFS